MCYLGSDWQPGVLFIIHYSCRGDEAQSDGLGRGVDRDEAGFKAGVREPDGCGNCFPALYEYEQGVFTRVPVAAAATDTALITWVSANVGDGSGSV